MAKLKLNFGDIQNKSDGRVLIKGLLAILNGKNVEPRINGKVVPLDQILKDETMPEQGFQAGLCPYPIRNVSVFEDNKTYTGEYLRLSLMCGLPFDFLAKYWKDRNFSVSLTGVPPTLEVYNHGGALVAHYESGGAIIVPRDQKRINEYLAQAPLEVELQKPR